MTKGIKIVTIGGGSSYTPELMEGFMKRYDQLPIREMWLVDIEEGEEKLKIIAAMAQRMWNASPYDVTIYQTLDRKEALRNADFVTTQFRVGLLEARIKDERIPFSYGMLGQETNGPGGIFKALRTIPVILEIVEDMKVLCPNAWLINFTNPSGIITEAIIKKGGWKKCIGLCNVPIVAMYNEPKTIQGDVGDYIYQFAGLNHFHWHKVYDKDGCNITNKIIQAMIEGNNGGIPTNIADVPFYKDQLKQMQMIPCGYHRYYYRFEEMLAHGLEEYHDPCVGTRGQQVQKTEKELFTLYCDPHLKHKPDLLAKRGGTYYSDAACQCINALYNDLKIPMVVSTQNNGSIPDLAIDSVVEVTSYITGKGAMPVAWGSFESAQRGWIQAMKAMEECVIDAAVSGDYGLVLQAFILNPLIPSGNTAKRVLDEMLIAHKKYLSNFSAKITLLEDEGILVKDEIARNLCEEGK